MEDLTHNWNVQKLFSSLKKHWEPLPFIIQEEYTDASESDSILLSIILAFWLSKFYILVEIFEDITKPASLNQTALLNTLYALLEMGAIKIAKKCLEKLDRKSVDPQIREALNLVDIALLASSRDTFISSVTCMLPFIHEYPNAEEERCLLFVIRQAVRFRKLDPLNLIYSTVSDKKCIFSRDSKKQLDIYHIWGLLLEKNWGGAQAIFNTYPYEELLYENSLLYFLYGCWLFVAGGKKLPRRIFQEL